MATRTALPPKTTVPRERSQGRCPESLATVKGPTTGYFPGVNDFNTCVTSMSGSFASILTNPTFRAYQDVTVVLAPPGLVVFDTTGMVLNLPAGTSTSS